MGLSLAQWMIHGEVERDPRGFDVARFGNWTTPGYTVPKVIENYRMRFSVAYPNEERPAARPLTAPVQPGAPATCAVPSRRDVPSGVRWPAALPGARDDLLGGSNTLAGFFGLLFLTSKLRDSGWGVLSVFGLTGFMGYTLGPILNRYLGMANGAEVVSSAFAMTALVFCGLSAYVLTTRRDFSFMGGFLFAGMVIALIASLGALFLQMPALGLAVAAMVALLSAGLILFETSRIVNGGETNYVLATVSLFVSLFNLFTSLLSLFGFAGNND